MGVGYDIEVVGGNLQGFLGDESKLRQLASAFIRGIVSTTYESIQRRLDEIAANKKPTDPTRPPMKTTGRLNTALRFSVSDLEGAIWMDQTIAPHAPYVERGVHRHEMRYLLNAKAPIPIPIGGKRVLFRRATEKWMGRPHPVWEYDEKAQLPVQHMTAGWIHPGYSGRWYFRDGAIDGIRTAMERQKRFVVRVAQVGLPALGEDL